MTPFGSSNPVLRRINKLSNQWLDFVSDNRARLLCWRFRSDERRMLDGFFAIELEEQAARHSDLFVQLQTEFASAADHGAALCAELAAQYQAEQEAMRANGMEASWVAPPRGKSEADIAFLVRTCASFAEHHELPGHLALVLIPRKVDVPEDYVQWLLAFAAAASESLRALVEDAALPAPAVLTDPKNERCVAVAADLDMPTAYAEVSESAGNRDAPGAHFRDNFLQLGTAIGAGDLPRAKSLGAAAVDISTTERWFHLSVPVLVALGGALAADGKIDEARTQYQAAEQSAIRGENEGAPELREACRKLRLQSRLSLGGALIGAEAYVEGATLFGDTIPLAAQASEQGMQLDCYRLAALCHELNADSSSAFRWGFDGLTFAKTLPAEALAYSSLQYLGDGLLRSCEPAGHAAQEPELAA